LHIVSPSTIPLTLGEEMAVLVLPLKSLLALASDRNKENRASNIASEPARFSISQYLNEQYRNCRWCDPRYPGRLSDSARPHFAKLLNNFIRQT